MSKQVRWGIYEDEPELAELEALLQAALEPVEPRPGFVRDLRNRLLNPGSLREIEPNGLRYGLLALAGIATSVLIVIAGVRATMNLLSSLGILHQVKDQVQQKQPAPLNPVL